MNKFKTILLLIMTVLMVMSVIVFAAEPVLEVTGEGEVEAGETAVLSVKIVSEEDIGVISGKIEGDGNITKISISGQNDWSLTAIENGSFIIMKAIGGKNEIAFNINCEIKEDAVGKANVTLSGLEMTTSDYKDVTLQNITKEIVIKGEDPIVALTGIEITKAPTKTKYEAGEKFNKEGMEVTATYSDSTSKVITNYTYTPDQALTEDDSKVVVSYSENGVTKTAEQAITVEKKAPINNNTVNNTTNNNTVNNNTTNNNTVNNNTTKNNTTKNNTQNPTIVIGGQNNKPDNTVANKELSKAGMGNAVFYATIMVSALGSIFYIKYNKMKEIK